ncbi:MAG TPA: GNAT family N-acetyltransferase [Chitinophaga sp.]|uniref:GNAT family N-acetyltransferase n=1 Tax=Chitinophaga sp. TaxID=1869181 RepID=UPI002BDA2E7F|nr:GNAT family N-acetyltransferase [Chitinophaga sp.]HVI48831.1 GNAT family N-acetyltransferase [Chitinophaga sp.]
MNTTLHIRKAEEQELSLILSMLKEAAEAIKNKGLDQWHMWLNPQPGHISWIDEGLKQTEFFIVNNEENEHIGMFRLSYTDIRYWGEQTDKSGYVHSLVVRKGFSGQNMGAKILRYVENLLVIDGYDLLRLDCNASNNWLCNYYENLGFKKVGEKAMPHSLNNLYEKKLH